MSPKKNIPADLKANAIEVLSCLKAPYLDVVFREAGRGTEDEAMAAVLALAKAEVSKSSRTIPVPPEMAPEVTDAYRAHVELTAAGAESDVLPTLLAVPEARAARAKEELPAAEDEIAKLNADAERLAEVTALSGREDVEDPTRLGQEIEKRERLIGGLTVAEGAIAFRAWWLYEGLGEVGATWRVWLATLLLSVASTVASVYLGTKVRSALGDSASPRLRHAGTGLTIAAGLA